MGDLWRSEPMQLVQLYIQRDAAHDTIDELGEIGLMHFHDVGRTLRQTTQHAHHSQTRHHCARVLDGAAINTL